MVSTAKELSAIDMSPKSSGDPSSKTDAVSPQGILGTIEAIMVRVSVFPAIRRNETFALVLMKGPASLTDMRNCGSISFGCQPIGFQRAWSPVPDSQPFWLKSN